MSHPAQCNLPPSSFAEWFLDELFIKGVEAMPNKQLQVTLRLRRIAPELRR